MLDAPAFRFALARKAILLLYLANGFYAIVSNSGTCDELGAHIPAGFLYWSSGAFGGGMNNAPLGQLLIALPVHALGLDYELYTEQHLTLFRWPVLFVGMLLGLALHRFSSRLLGEQAGLAALFLFSFSPNILAHSSLATLDLLTAAAVFFAISQLLFYVERPSLLRFTAFSCLLSVALLVKIQSVALLPITAIVLCYFARLHIASMPSGRIRYFATWLVLPVVAFLLVNLAYLHLPSPSTGWLPEQYVAALEWKLGHSSRGHFGFLMGEYSREGWWYFFPLAIAIKTPIPTLLLAAIGFASLLKRPSARPLLFILMPLGAFLGVGMISNVNIGLRHVLPVYPFLFAVAGAGAQHLCRGGARDRNEHDKGKKGPAEPHSIAARFATGSWQKLLVACFAVWIPLQAIWITPHHLSFFNTLVGGAKDGHKYMIDSNYDWGQNDRFLRAYIEESGREYKINPSAFAPTTGHILVNANAYYGVINGGPKAYSWLRRFEPVDQIAYTWFAYEVPEDAFPSSRPAPAERKWLIAHLMDLRDEHPEVRDPNYRNALAKAFEGLHAYDLAMEEVRAVLREDPTSRQALTLGGVLIVRHKLGVLDFEGDQYLTGFRTTHPQIGAPDEVNLPQAARTLRIAQWLSRTHFALGEALTGSGEVEQGIEALRLSLAFNPRNRRALRMLATLEAQQSQ